MKIPPEHKAQLVAIAAELGISLDEVIEQAIAQFLEEYSLRDIQRGKLPQVLQKQIVKHF